MSKLERVHIKIPPKKNFVEPVLNFIISYARELGAEQKRCEELYNACKIAVEMVIECYTGISEHLLVVSTYEHNRKLIIDVSNFGVPIIPGNTASLSKYLLKEKALSGFFDKMSVQNKGRQGQVVSLQMKLGKSSISGVLSAGSQDQIEINFDDIQIRPMNEGEEGALSRLFYHVYEYNYINEIVYYPEKIKEMMKDGRLISVVAALPDGRLLGHLGLMKWNDDPPVYEPCLGLTDPIVKGKGLFKKVLARIMKIADTLPMQYCFFDFVTNHTYSQKLVADYNPCELGIFLGCQSSQTQARLEKLGIGEDPKISDRFSILYSIIPKTKNPFGTEILLPNNIGEMAGFLLKPLDLTWSPAPRFSILEPEGEYKMNCEPTQGSVIFDCEEPGIKAVENILEDWRQLLRDGYQYAAVDVPLDKPGLAKLYDLLAEQGFFVAGFITYQRSSRLGFRFQAMAPTKVDFSEIKLYSERAINLLEIIRDDYERNCVV